jgi:hypothetical protein
MSYNEFRSENQNTSTFEIPCSIFVVINAKGGRK